VELALLQIGKEVMLAESMEDSTDMLLVERLILRVD